MDIFRRVTNRSVVDLIDSRIVSVSAETSVEDACEVAAITRQYDCGLVVEPGHPEDLAHKILTLYHDRTLAGRLGANARQAALAFDRPLQVRAYYHLFRELLMSPILP